MFCGDFRQLASIFFDLEPLVAITDGGLAHALVSAQRLDIGGNVVALVHKFGVSLDEADEFVAGHGLLARHRLRISGNELHDIIIVDHRGGKEHKLKFQLLNRICRVGLAVLLFLLGFQALSSFQVHPLQALQLIGRNNLFYGFSVFRGEIRILGKLGFQALDLFEQIDELAAGFVTLQIVHVFRGACQTLGVHKGIQLRDCAFQFGNDSRGGIDKPDFSGGVGFFAGKHGYGRINGLFLLAEVQNLAIGLGVVQYAISARKCLNQAMMFEIFVHIQGVEEFGIKTGEQHIHHNGDVDLLRVRQVLIGILLILDALLYVLIVQIKFIDAVICVVAGIIVGNNSFESSLFFFGSFGIIVLFLWQVFLNLLHILVAFRRWGKHTGDVQRLIVAVRRRALCLNLFEKLIILYRVNDARCGKQRIELALCG